MSIYTLPVMLRNEVGSNAVKRLRRNGRIPSILYGHKQENLNLSINKVDFYDALKARARMVNLEWGDINENALVKEVQYDLLGDEILHVDFTRVDAGEKVRLQVPIELYGEPVGHKKHGVLDHLLKEIGIECIVSAIPEKIRVDVSRLDIGQSVLVKDLDVPTDATITSSPDAVVASVYLIGEEKAPTEEELAEPEVIVGKKESEEEAE